MVMTATRTPHSSQLLWRLSARQHGVVTRTQLLEHGLSSEAIRHRLAEGRLHPVARGVYAVGRPEVSRAGRWLAAVLSCGPKAALSHASAASLWGVREQRARTPVDVAVPVASPRRRPGVRVHRAEIDPTDLTRRYGVPVVSPARMLLNQAAVLTPRRLEADVNRADALGLITPERLRSRLATFACQTGIVALRELLDCHTFTLTDSELERMFLPITRTAGLLQPLTGRRVNGLRVDFYWPGLGLIVETDGLRYHRTPTQQARDLVRDQRHKAAGLETLRFTHRQVAYERPHVVDTLAQVARRLSVPSRDPDRSTSY